jgi:hypothetical protein
MKVITYYFYLLRLKILVYFLFNKLLLNSEQICKLVYFFITIETGFRN